MDTCASQGLYKRNGRLIADTTHMISVEQLNNWQKIEDTILFRFSKTIRFPTVIVENVISSQVLCSVLVDTTGRFIEYRIEKCYSDNYFPVAVGNAM